jgi:hypothetical protein
MYNLLQPGVASDLIGRLAQLQPESKALWGNLTVTQMLTHCENLLQLVLGETQAKRSLAGVFFGAGEKKLVLQDEPLQNHKLAAHAEVMIKDTAQHTFTDDRRQLQSLLQRFAREGAKAVVAKEHPYFGKLTADEWGVLCYKQVDHHFRQFGV